MISSYLDYSSSAFSKLTTFYNNYSSSPDSVTIKFTMVHWAAISGGKCGLDILV